MPMPQVQPFGLSALSPRVLNIPGFGNPGWRKWGGIGFKGYKGKPWKRCRKYGYMPPMFPY